MLMSKKKTRTTQFSSLLQGFKRSSLEEPINADMQLFLGHTPSSKAGGQSSSKSKANNNNTVQLDFRQVIAKQKQPRKPRGKKKYATRDVSEDKMLFSKLSEAFRDNLTVLLYIEYIKVVAVGLNEMA